MKWFYDMKIGTKLMAAFMMVGMITAGVGFMAIRSLGRIADLAASSYANETVGIACIKEADVDLIYVGRARKKPAALA